MVEVGDRFRRGTLAQNVLGIAARQHLQGTRK